MEQLTPELERRLQVEELWARRNVLCDSINAHRRERFQARRLMLSRLGTQALPLPAHVVPEVLDVSSGPVLAMRAPRPMRPTLAAEPSGARRALRLAGFAAAAGLLLAIGLQDSDLGVTTRFETYMPRLIGMVFHRAPPPSPMHAAATRPPDLRAEVAAEIAAAISRKR